MTTWRSYLFGLGPVILVWAVLVGWLAWLIMDRSRRNDESDQAAVREWLDETRNFRKTLPELLREASRLRKAEVANAGDIRLKDEEIEEQLRALNEPLRSYPNQLPLFPEVYAIRVQFGSQAGPAYDSGLPRSRAMSNGLIRELTFAPLADYPDTKLTCVYRLHAVNKLQRLDEERRREALLAEMILTAATVLAGLYVFRFIRNERLRLTAIAEAEHRERELAETSARQRELERDLLQKRLDTQDLEMRAVSAEAAAADLQTQLFANIGIMAGSYAHNIKNLLVRPNDLLARCIDLNGLSPSQSSMLNEVKQTLGTVSDRLQQILSTVRRDPNTSIEQSIDLNRLAREAVTTWSTLAEQKWKVNLVAELADGELPIRGEESNLLQVIENLLFNARDATFEMRNRKRDAVRNDPILNAAQRREQLILAADWVGRIDIRTIRKDDAIVLEVSDNGIGMTDEVREKCLETHFSTKRDNALYEGLAAGMGLGLSFVATVANHHGATLTIDSKPNEGATFRLTFPKSV